MMEEIILTYLTSKLDVPVLMELPEVPTEDFPVWPDKFVVIERVGTSRSNHVKQASFAFQSYSLTRLYDAAALDEEVKAAVDDMVELDEIGGVRLTSNYNHTDIRTNRYRYQSVFDIYYV